MYPNRENYEWKIRGRAFYLWLTASLIDEKRAIAESAKHLPKVAVAKQKYRQLVRNPWFLAGYVDANAHFFLKPEGLRLSLTTRNKSLLMAIKDAYGGDLDIHSEAGKTVTLGGETFTTKENSWRLLLAEKAATHLFDVIGPKLQLLTLDFSAVPIHASGV